MRILLVMILFVVGQQALGDQLSKGWLQVYREVTGDEHRNWRGAEGARAWAVGSKDQVLAVLCRHLKDQQDDTTWRQMLPLLHVVCNDEARLLLRNRLSLLCNRAPEPRFSRMSADAIAVKNAILVLAKQADPDIQSLAIRLVTIEGQAYEVLEACVDALALAGNADALPVLKSLPLRRDDPFFDAKCKRAERLIEARRAHRDDRASPDERLIALTREFMEAIQRRDAARAEVVMDGRWLEMLKSRIGMDDFLNSPDMHEMVQRLTNAKQLRFALDDSGFEASTVGIDGAILTFTYGEDGWKLTFVLVDRAK